MVKNVEDAIMKSIMDTFQEDALKFFGINSRIISAARTELKNFNITTSFMDYTFLLDDNSFVHFEFQTTNNRQDLSRFLAYDAVLHYKEKKKVNTVVVYSAGIMGNTKDKSERVLDAIKITKDIKDNESQMNSLALLYAFAEKFVDSKDMGKITEVFRMTVLGKMLKEEGIKEGIKEGSRQSLITTAIRLLTKKFGPLPMDIKHRIEEVDITSLEIIVDSLLDFQTLEEVKRYL